MPDVPTSNGDLAMALAPLTEESFLGPLVNAPEGMARRIADLTMQVDFLDHEVTRYRELLETERIRHATATAELILASDARADDVRRDERHQIETLHASYRKLLAERQADFDATLKRMTEEHEATLAQERERHDHIVVHERARREAALASAKQRAHDALASAHGRSLHALMVQADAAKAAAQRHHSDIAESERRREAAEVRLQNLSSHIAELEERTESAIDRHRVEMDERNARLKAADERLAAARQRSAATLADVMARSASVATAADQASVHHAAELDRLERLLAASYEQAQKDLEDLAEAADLRARLAAEREAELEALIERLRSDRSR